jgi:hypothetical protein
MAEKKQTTQNPEEKAKQLEEKAKKLKVKHKEVTLIEIKQFEKHCFLKTPDRKVLRSALMFLREGDAVGAAEVVLTNCWLDGDEDIKTDDKLFFCVLEPLIAMIELGESTVKKF